MAIPERSELNPAFTWALEDLYSCDEAWQEEFDWDKDYLKTVKVYEGRLGESARLLLRYLELSDEMNVVFDKLANYAYRRADEDTRDSGPQAMCAQLTNFLTQLSTMSETDRQTVCQKLDVILQEGTAEQQSLYLDAVQTMAWCSHSFDGAQREAYDYFLEHSARSSQAAYRA